MDLGSPGMVWGGRELKSQFKGLKSQPNSRILGILSQEIQGISASGQRWLWTWGWNCSWSSLGSAGTAGGGGRRIPGQVCGECLSGRDFGGCDHKIWEFWGQNLGILSPKSRTSEPKIWEFWSLGPLPKIWEFWPQTEHCNPKVMEFWSQNLWILIPKSGNTGPWNLKIRDFGIADSGNSDPWNSCPKSGNFDSWNPRPKPKNCYPKLTFETPKSGSLEPQNLGVLTPDWPQNLGILIPKCGNTDPKPGGAVILISVEFFLCSWIVC